MQTILKSECVSNLFRHFNFSTKLPTSGSALCLISLTVDVFQNHLNIHCIPKLIHFGAPMRKSYPQSMVYGIKTVSFHKSPSLTCCQTSHVEVNDRTLPSFCVLEQTHTTAIKFLIHFLIPVDPGFPSPFWKHFARSCLSEGYLPGI